MKTLIIAFAFAVALGLSACNQTTQTVAKPHAWAFTITPQTTLHNIDSVSMAWKKDSIELKFTQLEFTDDGKLSILSGSVNFMSKSKLPSAKFMQDSICRNPLYIKLNDTPPSVSIGDK